MEKIFTDEIISDIYEEEFFDKIPLGENAQKLKGVTEQVLTVFIKTLTEKQKELYLDYLNSVAEENSEREFEIFKRGFLRGVNYCE